MTDARAVADNRRAARYCLEAETIVFAENGPQRGMIHDIGIHGARLSSEWKLEAGQTIEAMIAFHPSGHLLRVVGRIVWSTERECGVHFTETDPLFTRSYLEWDRRVSVEWNC